MHTVNVTAMDSACDKLCTAPVKYYFRLQYASSSSAYSTKCIPNNDSTRLRNLLSKPKIRGFRKLGAEGFDLNLEIVGIAELNDSSFEFMTGLSQRSSRGDGNLPRS